MQGTPTYAFETRDGQQVRVFSADMTDEARLRDLIDRATPENRVTASQSQPSTASADVAAVLLDGYTWIALIEGDPDDADPVAVARYSQVCEGEVAVSVVVRDDMQGRGIGSRMLYFLLDQARAAGARKAITSFASTNEAAWQVMQYSPYHMTWQQRGSKIDMVVYLQARASLGTTMN
ncbi:MAG: GNAT family N-acetyltransferase [Anaerolineae bacterium]|nr:GNAT family N-acetyltransferase [Anaerolineae bacterium]MCB9130382.1 GNAT family N-acetyltransferase [Anaerolineales bacterium]MCB0229650.1 GNAT family N-acetyltransferase [Anaerolineae bacterium]MCB0234330.1 GNAT family N-acetyltransferase [Anaerolineae bacterium]MCB0239562.1 GNAT family N-acetyltransferase [Anaerolineae bacterium]